jgi:branched-chain amino acid transport system permease protein
VIWLNQIVTGVLLGGYYALLASGLSLMFGVMRIINLAHGDLAILGAFLTFIVAHDLGWNPFVALVIALPAMGVIGWVLQRTMLERSLRSGVLVPLLATFGLAIVIENLLFQQYGADTRSLGPQIGNLAFDSWQITGQIYVGHLSALIFVVAVGVLGVLHLILRRTSVGRALRATAEDADTAELVGVNSRAIYGIAAGISVAIAGLAGVFLAMRSSYDPYSGPLQLIFAFEAVVIGGIGSLWGTLAGGIILGVAQNIGAQLNPEWQILTGHLVFLAILGGRLVVTAIEERGGLAVVLGRDA